MRRVKPSAVRPGGLYSFCCKGKPSESAVRAFSDEPTSGVNPYVKMGNALVVHDGMGWIPWVLLETRRISFLIPPAEGRTSRASRTMRMTLHHISAPTGRGWVEIDWEMTGRGWFLRCLSATRARGTQVG